MKVISLRKKLRYLLEALFIYSFYLTFKILGMKLSSQIGGSILKFFSKFKQENNIAIQNISMCLPQLSDNQRKDIIRNTWKHFGSVIGEIPHWHTISRKEFFQRVEIKQEENIPFTRAIIVSGHIGNWELISRIAKEYNIKLNILYRASNNPYVDYLINKIRKSHKVILILKGDMEVRKIINALNNNEVVGMMIDQRIDDGINTPFFSKNAMTTPLPANIAMKYKVPIIPINTISVGSSKYIIEFHKPLKIDKNSTKYTITKEINLIIEKWITKHPEQWLWFHDRWGTNKK